MIRLLIFGVLLLVSCQEKKTSIDKCDLYSLIINNDVVQRDFFICKEEKQTFTIYDKYSLFTDCDKKSVCNSEFTIRLDKPTVKRDQGNIEIYNLEEDGNNLKIFLYRPYSGVAVILSLEKDIENSEYKILKEDVGAF